MQITETERLHVIKLRSLLLVMQDYMDTLAKENPIWKTNVKSSGNIFRKALEREVDILWKTLPEDTMIEYNRLAEAIQQGVEEICRVAIID